MFPYKIKYDKLTLITSFVVDCVWDKWQVGESSKSCDGGERKISRERKVEAINGGQDCIGPSNITESCNVEGCPGRIYYIKSKLMWADLLRRHYFLHE